MTTSLLQRMSATAAIGAIPVLTICAFVPLTLYAGNSSEFAASFADVLRAILPFAAIIVAGFALLGASFRGAPYRRCLAVVAAWGVLVWLQGNILVWDYGVLDGRDIDWFVDAWRGVLDLAIWCIVLCVAYVGYKDFGRILALAAISTFGIQCVAVATTLVRSASTLQANLPVGSADIAGEAIAHFSRQQNVVHIVMDGFQSDLFTEIIDDPANADLKQQLQGFTLFRDNLGVYPYTQMTVPALLSSRLYRNEVPVEDFMSDVFKGDTILNAAFDAGFEVDIAAPVALKNIYSRARHSHAYGIAASDHVTGEDYIRNDAAKLIDLSLFRVVPHFAKALVRRNQMGVFQARIRSKSYLQMQYFSDLSFLSRLAEQMTVDRDAPVYKMIHVMLSHRPTVGNENCEYDGTHETTRANVIMQARCGLIRVVDVLRRMHDLGIYKQSLIVLMADHGAWVPVDALLNDQDNRPDVKMGVAMATPVLAIKPPYATEDMLVSSAPTSILDVPATISDFLGFDAQFDGTPVFSISNEAPRERRHLAYKYGDNPDAEGYLLPISEYRVDGGSLDASAWHLSARHFPVTAQEGGADAP